MQFIIIILKNHYAFSFYRYQSDKKLVVLKKGIVEELNFELHRIPTVHQKSNKLHADVSSTVDSVKSSVFSETAIPTTVKTTTVKPTPSNEHLTTVAASSEPFALEFKHHHYEEMVAVLKKVVEKCPNISRLYSVGKSVLKRELYVLEMSDNPGLHEPGMYDSLIWQY